MKFKYIPKTHARQAFEYVDAEDEFYSFVEEFNIVGVHWSEPTMISASYFRRLLEKGSSVRARGYRKGYNTESDEHSTDMYDFYTSLLDHGAIWKLRNGSVICTAMPYGNEKSICDSFRALIDKFDYPMSIRFRFLEDKYRYRPNKEADAADFCWNAFCDRSFDGMVYIPPECCDHGI